MKMLAEYVTVLFLNKALEYMLDLWQSLGPGLNHT